MLLKLFIVFVFLLMASSLQSCAHVDVKHINVKQMTYKALRQQDCRMNEPDTFCEKGYSNEYLEYERLRQQFLQEKTNKTRSTDSEPNDRVRLVLET